MEQAVADDLELPGVLMVSASLHESTLDRTIVTSKDRHRWPPTPHQLTYDRVADSEPPRRRLTSRGFRNCSDCKIEFRELT
jgi:hypothetical protein